MILAVAHVAGSRQLTLGGANPEMVASASRGGGSGLLVMAAKPGRRNFMW